MGPKDWFASWFGTEYKRLYPHRDLGQAADQVAALFRIIPGDVRDVLDIGCGAGRHLRALREARVGQTMRIIGVDLSAVLLRDARSHGSNVTRADMRRLPFADASFDLTACFFTSFGYFATPAEDAAALHEFARVTRPGGLLFLDLPNRDHLLRNLVASEESESEGRRIRITRALEDDCVVKRIRIFTAQNETEEEVYEERVRLWSTTTLSPVLDALGLQTAAVLGDERGGDFDPETSPRMSLVLKVAA